MVGSDQTQDRSCSQSSLFNHVTGRYLKRKTHKEQRVNSGTLLPVSVFRNIVDDVMNEMFSGIYSALNIS